ncbi:MFS transporter [Actinoallomurus vinaceus]|uniref:MFS transporter n=1 Tax=Actinoallomurus vinaceus TaxID=1080074 RepID=A0ABP8U701_9ACTN
MTAGTTAARTDRPATFADLFRSGEYRALWISGLVSRAGDQLARVALALLVFDRSGSPFLTALTYTLTTLPALVGGPLLGGLADRYPRRGLIAVCNLVRAALGVAMALPMVPFAVLCALVFAMQLLEPPERAARTALIHDVLPEEVFSLGVAANQLTYQVTVLAGFAGGAVVVAAIGPYPALAVNAATFLCCALIVWAGVRRRPAAAAGASVRRPIGAGEGLRVIVGSPQLRSVLAIALLAGFLVIPEGIAVPYAAQIGMPARLIGLLLAAIPAGNVLGMLLIGRMLRKETQVRAMGPLAALAGVPFIVCALRPGSILSVALWALSGVALSYQMVAQAEFVRATPDRQRGQAVGLAGSAISAIQGIGVLLGGALADHVGAASAIAVTGVASLVVGTPLAVAWHRVRANASSPAPAAEDGAEAHVAA